MLTRINGNRGWLNTRPLSVNHSLMLKKRAVNAGTVMV